ncbi:unnamed protein product [Cylicocyclus nassatus]|uniref:Uncharacterized protein n=1 Tax=Cylicocyclus nassatus TaxID=53992 RepID=A0AA36M1Y2_CYLNA|nr:unnamed protein product [Cylicocyclus nassatus]
MRFFNLTLLLTILVILSAVDASWFLSRFKKFNRRGRNRKLGEPAPIGVEEIQDGN